MKITIEVEVTKEDGPRVDADEVAEALCEEVLGIGSFEAQNPDKDDVSVYSISDAESVTFGSGAAGIARAIGAFCKKNAGMLESDEDATLGKAREILAALAAL